MDKGFIDKRLNELGKKYCAKCTDGDSTKWDPCYKCCCAWMNFEYKIEWTGTPLYFREKEET